MEMHVTFGRLALAWLAVCAGPAFAQATNSSGWYSQITPYVWATGLGGTVQPFAGAPSVAIDKSFGELLSDLDAAFFISGLVRRDRLVAIADFSTSTSSRDGVLPSPPAPAPLPATGRLRQASFTLAGGYRVVDDAAVTVDLLAGLRHWNLRASADVPAVPALGFPGAAASAKRSLTDPIVAARVNASLAPNLGVLLYGDVGGFGVGSESTVQLMATLNWQVAPRWYLSAGYRHLQVDYRGRGSVIDMAMSGPILGVTFGF
jgi:hypothetical protein